jgi:hypothetical protein
MTQSTGKTIPCLPAISMEESLPFWQTLGFEVTYQQKAPNAYAVIQRDNYELHLFGLKGLNPKEAYSTCLIIVPEVEQLHQTFKENLRSALGKVPSAGFPRISRMKPGQTRFTITDPAGNSVIFIRDGREDQEAADEYKKADQTSLQKALNVAARLRDFKLDDLAAAKALDNALTRDKSEPGIDRAKALAARIELAEALGEETLAVTLRSELQQIPLSPEERNEVSE